MKPFKKQKVHLCHAEDRISRTTHTVVVWLGEKKVRGGMVREDWGRPWWL